MNPYNKEAMKIMIPLIRKYIPNRVMSHMADVQPMHVSKEDMWRMCIAVEMGKKDLL